MPNGIRLQAVCGVMTGVAMLAGCAAAPPPPPPVVVAPPQHPAYLHALSDLHAARKIKRAAFDDGKNANARPPVDEHPDNRGRIRQASQFLIKARADIASEEDNGFANGLRDRAIGHIDAAIHAAHRVFKD